jgi:glycerol dehydrogenase-like iron-containing ADH family enzyme
MKGKVKLMTKDLAAVRWAVLVALMLFAVALAGVAVSAVSSSHGGSGAGHVFSLAGDPDSGGE